VNNHTVEAHEITQGNPWRAPPSCHEDPAGASESTASGRREACGESQPLQSLKAEGRDGSARRYLPTHRPAAAPSPLSSCHAILARHHLQYTPIWGKIDHLEKRLGNPIFRGSHRPN